MYYTRSYPEAGSALQGHINGELTLEMHYLS